MGMITLMSTVRHTVIGTDLGDLTVVLDTFDGADVLVGLYFPGHWTLPDVETFGPAVEREPLADETACQLEEYLAGERRDFALPMAMRGSDFNQRVWAILLRLGYGETTTYGAIAAELGAAAQPVGRAVGANPISVVVPCHRVVGSDGSITGYAGGLDRKRRLLALEEPAADERGALF